MGYRRLWPGLIVLTFAAVSFLTPSYVTDGWYSYDYNGGSGSENVFYPAVRSGQVFSVDDSGWRIDTPESPDSVLALLRYEQWIFPGPVASGVSSVDLRGATITFDLRGDNLDLKGGHATFWVYCLPAGDRWHYTAEYPQVENGEWRSFTLEIPASPTSDGWHNSWRAYREQPLDFTAGISSVASYGIGFVGFDAEPTGQLDMRNWLITLP